MSFFCKHDGGCANLLDETKVIIGSWCYKCHKTWFKIPKGMHPLDITGRDYNNIRLSDFKKIIGEVKP